MAQAVLFVRVNPATRELLLENLRGMNASRPMGEPMLALGNLVERCVLQVLAPQQEQETPNPKQLPLPLSPKRRRKGGK